MKLYIGFNKYEVPDDHVVWYNFNGEIKFINDFVITPLYAKYDKIIPCDNENFHRVRNGKEVFITNKNFILEDFIPKKEKSGKEIFKKNQRGVKKKNLIKLDNLTILIKSFLRPSCVDNLLNSILSTYDVKIVIIDDSDPHYSFDYHENIKTYNLPFDSGLSKGRNYGVSKIETKYFLLCDDDFEFTRETDLLKWFNIFKQSDLDILAGDVIENNIKFNFHGIFERKENVLYYKRGFRGKTDDYYIVDFAPNFFIAKTKSIKKYGWDDKIKLHEHTAFFLDIKDKLKVGYSNKFLVNHKQIIPDDYLKFRHRKKYGKNSMEERNVEQTVNLGTKFQEKNVFIYWVGKEYTLIKLLRKLMIQHQKSGRGYTLHFINEDNLNQYVPSLPSCFSKLLPAHQADFIRINVLNRFGGIWLDSDMIVMNNLDYYFDILDVYDGFFQQQERISIGFIGSIKNNPILSEWIKRSTELLEKTDGKINWPDIGTNMIESIKKEKHELFSNTLILDAYSHTYPFTWDKIKDEVCIKPYDNYRNCITNERSDLLMLVNSVYKYLENYSEEEIMNCNMPIAYFLKKSIENLKNKN